jgi:hypothetical protein
LIAELLQYGSALYWALLFFFVYMITVFAEQRINTLRPNLWAFVLFLFIFGFTNYSPSPSNFTMGVISYILIGAGFALYKWVNLVAKIKRFNQNMALVSATDSEIAYMAYQEFYPNDACNQTLKLPPDPYEFRTRLWLWFMYWPCFTAFRSLTYFHKKIARIVWSNFNNLSAKIYDR